EDLGVRAVGDADADRGLDRLAVLEHVHLPAIALGAHGARAAPAAEAATAARGAAARATAAGRAAAGGAGLPAAAAGARAPRLPRGRLRVGRPEAQRRVGDAQRAALVGVDERDVRGHARAELEVRVVDVDDGVVGDDVLDGLRRVADLADLAAEALARVRVDGERGRHVRRELADVRLGDVGVDLHLLQVLGDGEQRGRLQRGGHRLADVDVARDDDTVDGGDDVRVVEVDLGLVEPGAAAHDLALGGLDVGAGGVEVGLRGVDVGLGDEVPLGERLG